MKLPQILFCSGAMLLLLAGALAAECLYGNCKNNYGIKLFPDGTRYMGYFHAGEFHGHGTFFWPDGRKFSGQWKQGRRYGWGTLYDPAAAPVRCFWLDTACRKR